MNDAPRPDLRLLPIDAQMARLAETDADLEEQWQVRLGDQGELARQVIRQTAMMLAHVPREMPWGGYLTVDEADGKVIGACGFKTGPTADGSVEIAYFTFPPFENRGFATAMAAALVGIARDSGAVRRVIAHTLPQAGASTRVLAKVGFQLVGEADVPEEGRVWLWQVILQP